MIRSATAALLLLAATPALAQEEAAAGPPPDVPLPDPNDRSDTLTIAAGARINADYEGSDDYEVGPAAAIRGRFRGIRFSTRGLSLYVDLVPSRSDLEFNAGPIIGLRGNRRGNLKDDVVDALPNRKRAVEVGGFAGVTFKGLTNPYDGLSFRLDVTKDIANAHESTIFAPAISFGTPLSRKFYVSVGLSADWVADRYADYYYSITPADSLASGLPPFDADGGLKEIDLSLLVSHSLTGDLTGGLSLFVTGGYSRLLGDFKRSPIVDQRGSPNQWLAAAGLAYTF